jgi:putative restriction endonuclease
MLTPADYLEIRLGDARQQWRAITARTMPAPGARQVRFSPVETVLCLAASLSVDCRRYGGANSHKAEEPIPTLARIFRRPNSSVLEKMANLEGSRTNGAKHEVEIAARLLSDPALLSITYRLILAAARAEGVDAKALPDFLELEADEGEVRLLGQRDLNDADIEEAVRDAVAQRASERQDLDEQMTERLLVAVARVGQHRFAASVLRNHGHRCVFCGLSAHIFGIKASRMLLAGHIKPWRASTSGERLDPRNGLTACPTHDVAFDCGLLTVDEGLRIHLAPGLEDALAVDPATRAAFGRPPLADRLVIPNDAPRPKGEYLQWHHSHVYLGESLGPRTG